MCIWKKTRRRSKMKKAIHIKKVRLKLREATLIIACLAATTVFASFRKEMKPIDEEDVEFTIWVSGKWSWTPFFGRTGVIFTNSDNNVLSLEDNGTRVRFTGKQVGESTITATFNNQTLKALVRVCATEGGKKYFTYNKPVTAYYIEYNGGMIDANKKNGTGHYGNVVEAYEDKKYTEIQWSNSAPGWSIWHISPNGLDYTAIYGSKTWNRHTGNGDGLQDDGAWKVTYINKEYPLGYFAAYVSKNGTMPYFSDVTEFYIRSEIVMDMMCDVYKNSLKSSGGTETWTWWVDPATGFTLKYERVLLNGDIESYEVTKLVIGKPDWDGKHLHPITGDTFIDVD